MTLTEHARIYRERRRAWTTRRARHTLAAQTAREKAAYLTINYHRLTTPTQREMQMLAEQLARHRRKPQ